MAKKIISLCLSFLLLMTMTIPASASENAPNDVIGYLTLFAVNNGTSADLGHVFLQFENTYSITLTIGPYGVEPGTGITLSTWRDLAGHEGIAYNADAYLYHNKDRFPYRASITIPITSADRAIINDLLYDNRAWDYNAISANCVDFSLLLWYAVCDEYYFTTGKSSTSAASPRVLYNSIRQFNDHEMGIEIIENDNVKSLLSTYTLGYINTNRIDSASSLSQDAEYEQAQTPVVDEFLLE